MAPVIYLTGECEKDIILAEDTLTNLDFMKNYWCEWIRREIFCRFIT